jgi:DUF4097 and DUF4098 domain-containing protein YvlB
MKLLACVAAFIVLWLAWSGDSVSLAADGSNISAVNSSVHAQDGQTYDTLSTVNGDVRVGKRAVANQAKTVNGNVSIEEEARVGEVSTINGSVDLAEGVSIERETSTVNGQIELRKRARVGGDVATVSGDIELEGAEVGGELRTNNGDIELRDGAHVRGGIHVKKNGNKGWTWNKDYPPKVTICASCVVDGDLRFERPVVLRVENGAKIGKVIGDDVRRL